VIAPVVAPIFDDSVTQGALARRVSNRRCETTVSAFGADMGLRETHTRDAVIALRIVAEAFVNAENDERLTQRGLALAELASDLEAGGVVLQYRREAEGDGG
jgi:hypothetical protein